MPLRCRSARCTRHCYLLSGRILKPHCVVLSFWRSGVPRLTQRCRVAGVHTFLLTLCSRGDEYIFQSFVAFIYSALPLVVRMLACVTSRNRVAGGNGVTALFMQRLA